MNIKGIKLFQHVNSIKDSLLALTKKKSFKFGLPFFVFVMGGSFGLKEWSQLRYQFAQVKGVSREEAKKMGLHKDKDVTLETVYEDIQKLDIDNWENKRGPRPWEMNAQENKK